MEQHIDEFSPPKTKHEVNASGEYSSMRPLGNKFIKTNKKSKPHPNSAPPSVFFETISILLLQIV